MTESTTLGSDCAEQMDRSIAAVGKLGAIRAKHSVEVLTWLLELAQWVFEQPFDADVDAARASHDELRSAIDGSDDFLILYPRRDPHRAIRESEGVTARLASAIAAHINYERPSAWDHASLIDLAYEMPW